MQLLVYILFRVTVALMSILPFSALYALSNVIAWLLQHVIKYRKKVVTQNLATAFPQKSVKERQQIVQNFYQHFADIVLESFKGVSLSKAQLIERHHGINCAVADAYFEQDRTVIAVGSHYTNWEWAALSSGLQVKHPTVTIYKKITNKYIDAYVKRTRAKFDMDLVPTYEIGQLFEERRKEVFGVIMLNDQSPRSTRKAHWLNFLNQDTACLHGLAKYAQQYDLPILFINLQRVKRGYYTFELEVLVAEPNAMTAEAITQRYMKRVEKVIQAEPAYWLWSHRRWKKKRD